MSFVNGVGNVDKATFEQLQKSQDFAKTDAKVSNYEFDESSDKVAVEVKFKSKENLESEGKTYHMIAAHDGPDKGSHYYRSEDYDMWGYYKKK